MQARVGRGEARDDGVLVDEERVARDQVAPIDALTDEHRVLERAIVVLDVELVEATIDAGELERRAAHADRRRPSLVTQNEESPAARTKSAAGGGRAARRRRVAAAARRRAAPARATSRRERSGRERTHRRKYRAERRRHPARKLRRRGPQISLLDSPDPRRPCTPDVSSSLPALLAVIAARRLLDGVRARCQIRRTPRRPPPTMRPASAVRAA